MIFTSSSAPGPCKLLFKPHTRPFRGHLSARQPTVIAMRAVVQRVKSASVTVGYCTCKSTARILAGMSYFGHRLTVKKCPGSELAFCALSAYVLKTAPRTPILCTYEYQGDCSDSAVWLIDRGGSAYVLPRMFEDAGAS